MSRPLLILISSFMITELCAQLTTARIFSDNMVIQRDQNINIWGTATPGQTISVDFSSQSKSTKVTNDGSWMLTLDAMKAGGPYTLKVTGDGEKTFTNIMIGDVWICSGQSNMEWKLHSADNSDEEIANADYPGIRHFEVPKTTSLRPQSRITGGKWEVCSPETAANFTAVGYFFGREIHQETGVTIGLLHTSWGGTNVETWIPLWKLKELPEYRSSVDILEKSDDLRKMLDKVQENLTEKMGDIPEVDPGMKDGIANWASKTTDYDSWETSNAPGHWEWSGLKGFDGIVWYQTEFDLTEAEAKAPITVNLGMIDDADITFLNGSKIGEMNAYNEHRSYMVPAPVLQAGKNSLVVRIHDTGGGGGFSGPNEKFFVKTSSRTISLVGNWQRKVGTGVVIIDESPNDFPTQLYNTMIHPLINFPVKGAIWYQGESNAWNAAQYASSFPAMIQSWRKAWSQPEMPFYFVQLANFMDPVEAPGDHEWAELREAQLKTLSLPNTGMASAIDIGEADDIHPRNKQDVGLRLAKIALNKDYGKSDLVYSGPIYESMEIVDDQIILNFSQTGSGLMAKDQYGYLKGFAIAGKDRKFYWAKAEIEGDKVIVSSDKVKDPVAVRYGWAANPDDANLYNQQGLPASPFRTDDWEGLTDAARYEPSIDLK